MGPSERQAEIDAALDVRLHVVRSELLGLFAQVDDRIDLVLAASHGRDLETVLSLYLDVFPRAPANVRMAQFKRVLSSTELPRRPRHRRVLTIAEARPLLLLLIKEIVEVRHVLAHAIAYPLTSDVTVTMRQRRQGRLDSVTLDIRRLEGLVAQGQPLLMTLDDVVRVVTDPEIWGTFSGFDEAPDDESE
jgi:hypothetical protein